MFLRSVLASLASSLFVSAALAQDAAPLDPEIEAVTQALIADALEDEVGLKFVEDLTTEVGQRLAGS